MESQAVGACGVDGCQRGNSFIDVETGGADARTKPSDGGAVKGTELNGVSSSSASTKWIVAFEATMPAAGRDAANGRDQCGSTRVPLASTVEEEFANCQGDMRRKISLIQAIAVFAEGADSSAAVPPEVP